MALACALALLAPAAGHAGDILRGGSPASRARNNAAGGGTSGTSAAADLARQNASDALARTTRAVQAMQQLQLQARNQIGGSNNLGADPNHAGQTLPNVVDGLRPGGLQRTGTPVVGADNPVEVVGGDGRTTVTIKQQLQQAFLEWQTFNVGKKTTVYFDQTLGGKNAGQWIAFNNVKDPTGVPSQIMGQIKAEGQVYIINRNGIIFGATSQVNTHALVASALPINTNLVSRGLLNNPDVQFLFSALPVAAGSKGTPAFTPELDADKKIGDVTVQAGAQLTAPTTADNVGGRISLIGANVSNAGTISTPDGQTILAAGLQVGMVAHSSGDPSLRGLDVFVGAVADSTVGAYSGSAGGISNTGIISAARGSMSLSGKTISQAGALMATTSVSLNGRIDLNASYDAVSNPAYNPANTANGAPFLYASSGTITLGANSVTQIMPEVDSTAKVVGIKLALPSQINMTGKVVHLESDAMVLAPNADLAINAGVWDLVSAGGSLKSTLVMSGGQVYMDTGSSINVAGTAGVVAPLSENIITLQLRGSEFSDFSYNRDGPLRGIDITIDVRRQGIFNGKIWYGTPIADASGYVGLIQRGVDELTTAGGTVKINSGGAVILQNGSSIDVSGGTIDYQGGMVETTRVAYGSQLIDISKATPDRVYGALYTGSFTATSAKWGVGKTYTSTLMSGKHYEAGYTYGAAGGSVSISAPSMALDGDLKGNTVNGARQREVQAAPSTLNLTFQAQKLQSLYPFYSPTPPVVTFQNGVVQPVASAFALDASGNPIALRNERVQNVVLSSALFSESGFGNLAVDNKDGDIVVAAGESLVIQPKGSITLNGANVTINGSITTPGGSISLNAYNISPSVADELKQSPSPSTPPPTAGRGVVTVNSGAALDVSGSIVDDRLNNENVLDDPYVLGGGSVAINGYSVNLAAGSTIDVSGGARIDWLGKRTYGDGGSINVKAGQDRSLAWVLGGKLTLGAEFMGIAGVGKRGGALSLQAPLIQIGGTSTNPDLILLQPDFFNQGGFSSWTLNGIGAATGVEQYTPGLVIAPGTVIDPVVQNFLFEPAADSDGPMKQTTLTLPTALRSSISLSFGALGATDDFSRLLKVRGDVEFGAGAIIRAGTQGSVSFKGDTVSVLGSIYAPGGAITIKGSDKLPSLNPNPTEAFATVYIGPNALLSAAGAVVLTPDAYGRRTGYVLAGGTISVGGNIVAEQGAVMDVSGASGELDVDPALLGLTSISQPLNGNPGVPASSGLTTPVDAIAFVRKTIDSSGGSIQLKGGQELFTRATLVGNAGGAAAAGGSLSVASGRFYLAGAVSQPNDLNLVVTQSHPAAAFYGPGDTAIGKAIAGSPGMGYFAANDFSSGGFDNLQLGGNVKFDSAVTITARGALSVGTGGVIYAGGDVNLTARYIALGTVFATPLLPTQVQNPFLIDGLPFTFAPTFGPGKLTVKADLIDIGNLSLQNVGNAQFIADNGDIRGDGTLDISGDLAMRAAQIYPVTGVAFTIAAYDHSGTAGSVTFQKSGIKALPMSAGGTLNVYASNITQNGVLRAPFGVINLGWDGSGTAPKDLITGANLALPATKTLVLGAGSITSVSAIDPTTNKGVLIPYGTSPTGTSWIDPAGVDITSSGLPVKAVNLGGASIDTQAGSLIDVRGGGDLFAYRFVSGVKGTKDILANTGAFAVIPGYSPFFAPFGAFNTSTDAANLNGDRGFTNSTQSVGDQVYLGGGGGLTAGLYTLLPARYALMPGAFLVTPQSGIPTGQLIQPDGANLVNGYRYNTLNSARSSPVLYSSFELASAATISQRAQYDLIYANDFLTKYATDHHQAVQRLPQDSGQVVLSAITAMALNGAVQSPPVGKGRGGIIDISSPVDIVISYPGAAPSPGKLVLDSAQLSSFGSESLLIGGVRSFGTEGTTINVKTNNVTVSNVDPSSGLPAELKGPEIILVANKKLTIDPGSAIKQTGLLSGAADTLLIGNASVLGSGDGALLRVSSDVNAQILRGGVNTSSIIANMVIGANASVTGNSVTIDSTYATTLNGTATIDGKAVSLNSGQISIRLDSPGALQSTKGLVITGVALNALQSATSLSLLSYTTLDIYGNGTLGSAALGNLSLHAGEIRGFNVGTGTATLQAQNIVVDNVASGRALGPVPPTPNGKFVLDGQTVHIGAKDLRVTQYSSLTINAAKGLYVEGDGSLFVAGNLTINTPFISAARSSTQSISTAGVLSIRDNGSATSSVAGGLGASLTLQGSSVDTTADIILPSGIINLNATTGNLTVGGIVSVAGAAQSFYDLTKYTGGGNVTLGSTNGNVLVNGSIDVGAHASGGEAGSLTVNASKGVLTLGGTLRGKGGASFSLDVGSLANTASISTTLNAAEFSGSRSFRVRGGNVIIGGTSVAHFFALSADAGKIDVTGTINASGITGGTINLMAAQGVTVKSGAVLNVSATTYDNAGKGGSVSLETLGTSSGYVSIESGSTINLGVAATAKAGQFSGTLRLRAPQNAGATDLFVKPVAGTITGASSITAEGFKIYDLTGSGKIDGATRADVLANGTAFGANDTAIADALFTGANTGLKNVFSLLVGAEIINSTGDLTLGDKDPASINSPWDFSSYRFGSKLAPGVLTLRASGDLIFYEALSDGFASGAYNALLLGNNVALSDNAESWSYRLTAGADLTAADFRQVINGTGSLRLGRDAGDANEIATNFGNNAKTALAVAGFYQVIRTGSGNIDIAAGKDVRLLNQFATIYTAGTQVSNPTLGGTFDTPIIDFAGGTDNLGAAQQSPAYAAQYSLGGGNVTIAAGSDIIRYTQDASATLVPDSERQLPINWLYRRGYTAGSGFGAARFGDVASTTWWVDFSNFFEGVGALGGGNVTMTAGRDISNVDAVVPTNARMPKTGQSASQLVELGGGDIILRTGGDLDAGVYYVERGTGSITARGSIHTNGTRSLSLTNLADAAPLPEENRLPTTLFVGKSTFDVEARGDLLLGPVSNAFLLPGGYNNSFWYKSYFSTYSQNAGVEASSLSGDVTLRESTTLPSTGTGAGASSPILLAWLQKELIFNGLDPSTAAYFHPWLRMNETKVDAFSTAVTIMPGTVKVTAFSGSINVVGNLTLSPSSSGTLDLAAAVAINALQINGETRINGVITKTWGSSRINVSDSDPASLPGVTTPFAFQTISGLLPAVASASGDNFLSAIDNAFRESGSTIGTYGVLQTKQALHAQGILHANDDEPLHIYAGGGDISGLTLFSPKAARIVSAQDIRDISLYIQNTSQDDVSVVSSGRDIIAYDSNSVLRNLSGSAGNALNFGELPMVGDIQISGPGTLEVLAGRNLDLGIGGNSSDGTGVGLTSIGNGRNPSLSFDGANIIAGAGIGASYDLSNSGLAFGAFITKYIEGADGPRYLTDYAKSSGSTVDTLAEFNALTGEEKKRVTMEIFYIVLRDSGRDHTSGGDAYTAGFDAITTLFPGSAWQGDIKTQARDIRTKSGGNIGIFAPGGGLQLATSVIGQSLAPPGIITESGGSISIFTDKNVDIGISRIFTLRGGDEIIWASHGNIAAGSSSKTVQSAPPTRVVIDPQSGDLKTDLAGLATGGGIGVLATVAGVPPGSVDLIAPNGTIDAGDAGIRATGNLNIAALTVLNASNISAGGTTAGAPASSVSAPNVGGLTSSSNSAAAAGNSGAPKPEDKAKAGQNANTDDIPSIMSVEVLGYGGGEGEDEDEKKKRAKGSTTRNQEPLAKRDVSLATSGR